MNLFGKKSSIDNDPESLLDQVLYKVPGNDNEITWADAVEGTLITGSTGSGKSSGPGKHIALAMLKSNFGFVVLCAKPDERQRWEEYARSVGRQNDLVIFNKQSGLKFNFLEYEMKREGEGAGDVLNVTNILKNLNEQNHLFNSGGQSKKDEQFWENSVKRIIGSSVTTLQMAGEEVSIKNMQRIVSSSFRAEDLKHYKSIKYKIITDDEISLEEREDARRELDWLIESDYFIRTIEKIRGRLDRNEFSDPEDVSDAEMALDYWLETLPKIGEKTTSIIIESFMGTIDPFLNRGILRGQFSNGLSEELKPENTYLKNKIIVIDFPIKEFGLAGAYAATIYKSVFQSAMERRDISKEVNPIPVALWVDEYQLFYNQSDGRFQDTARSSWVATTYITQNINNLFYVMGDNQPEARAKGILGNLNLKYFCSNSDYSTNEWASQMIGQHLTDVVSTTIDKNNEVTKTINQVMQFRITPDHFTTLKTGRRVNDYIVEAVVFKAGKVWGKNKENYALVKFKQG